MMKKLGFTLIEVTVVIGTVAIALPSLFFIIYSIYRQQARIVAVQEVKNQGDFALNSMKNSIRISAVSIHSADPPNSANRVCSSSGLPVDADYFMDKSGGSLAFQLSGDKIISRSSVEGITDLTGNKVAVSNFNIECQAKSSFSPPIVTINFDINYKSPVPTPRPEEAATLHYQTKVRLRNF